MAKISEMSFADLLVCAETLRRFGCSAAGGPNCPAWWCPDYPCVAKKRYTGKRPFDPQLHCIGGTIEGGWLDYALWCSRNGRDPATGKPRAFPPAEIFAGTDRATEMDKGTGICDGTAQPETGSLPAGNFTTAAGPDAPRENFLKQEEDSNGKA